MLQAKPQCARGLACVPYECRVYVPSVCGFSHFWVLGEWCKVASLRQGDTTHLKQNRATASSLSLQKLASKPDTLGWFGYHPNNPKYGLWTRTWRSRSRLLQSHSRLLQSHNPRCTACTGSPLTRANPCRAQPSRCRCSTASPPHAQPSSRPSRQRRRQRWAACASWWASSGSSSSLRCSPSGSGSRSSSPGRWRTSAPAR